MNLLAGKSLPGGIRATPQDVATCSYAPLAVSGRMAATRRRWASSPASHTGHRGRLVAMRMSGSEEMYDNLFNSPVFRSELVMKEFTVLVKEVAALSQMAAKFPDFDLAGKQMYLDKMEESSSRYEIFIKRLELSQDPAAKEYLRSTNAQMLEGGFTLQQMFMGLKESLGEYRKWVEQEEKVSGDPIAHQQFLEYFRKMWGMSALGKLDMSYLINTTDPQVLMRAQQDPQFWVAIREISTSPSPDVLSKWLDHPSIGPLVAEMWKSMQKGGGPMGGGR